MPNSGEIAHSGRCNSWISNGFRYALALGKCAGCRITEPGGGAGDERDRMFHGRLRGEGGRSSREAPRGQGRLANFEPFGYILV
jgi:hypothetical protein